MIKIKESLFQDLVFSYSLPLLQQTVIAVKTFLYLNGHETEQLFLQGELTFKSLNCFDLSLSGI